MGQDFIVTLLDGEGVDLFQGRREQLPEACNLLDEGNAGRELASPYQCCGRGCHLLRCDPGGLKDERHEFVADVVEVILLQPVFEGSSFVSSTEILFGCCLDEGLVEGTSDREIKTEGFFRYSFRQEDVRLRLT